MLRPQKSAAACFATAEGREYLIITRRAVRLRRTRGHGELSFRLYRQASVVFESQRSAGNEIRMPKALGIVEHGNDHRCHPE